MNQLYRFCGVIASIGLVGACAEPGLDEDTSTTSSALTTDDSVDYAPECYGIIQFANEGTLAMLDNHLPYNIASALVSRRAVQPFTSLADISSVSGVAQARLAELYAGAMTYDYVDYECVGVYEEVAVSWDDKNAIIAYANTASEEELREALYMNVGAVANLIAARPFTSLGQIVGVTDIGPATFRGLRDGALDSPFDVLAKQVNGLHRDAEIRRGFSWFGVINTSSWGRRSLTCFGLDEAYVTSLGGVNRPNLADAAEVLAEVSGTVSFANRYHELTVDPAVGLATLAARLGTGTFSGCYLGYEPDPWSGVNIAFFID
ncbi:MAG: hypothetical protein ACTHU0_02255, partial [Kofleriaceae bacterium]